MGLGSSTEVRWPNCLFWKSTNFLVIFLILPNQTSHLQTQVQACKFNLEALQLDAFRLSLPAPANLLPVYEIVYKILMFSIIRPNLKQEQNRHAHPLVRTFIVLQFGTCDLAHGVMDLACKKYLKSLKKSFEPKIMNGL